MKNSFSMGLLLFLLPFCTACKSDKNQAEPLEIDEPHQVFDAEGGSVHMQLINYERWWIKGGSLQFGSDAPMRIPVEETGPYSVNCYWLNISIEDKNKLVGEVQVNAEGRDRTMRLLLTVGTADKEVIIHQKAH